MGCACYYIKYIGTRAAFNSSPRLCSSLLRGGGKYSAHHVPTAASSALRIDFNIMTLPSLNERKQFEKLYKVTVISVKHIRYESVITGSPICGGVSM